jgi:hypothetical protein
MAVYLVPRWAETQRERLQGTREVHGMVHMQKFSIFNRKDW